MPSFLSKVFGRKKLDGSDDPPRLSDVSLLEGKFEAVSPTISPTAANFPDGFGKDKEKEKDGRLDNLPHLTLNLPGPKDDVDARALGVVFEADPTSRVALSDSDISERRLNPLETLILVKACSQTITERGLETLGIMHPHWYSASPDTQRKLISLFIQSLAPKTQITTLSPSPTAPVSAFESELSFTRSPHDVAAVLRWGLRHLKLEGSSFGKESDEWSWYTNFAQAERDASYPPKVYSEKLVPQLVPAHLELLNATLEIFSSLAAHSETNSISGTKLSKFLGLWLLSAHRFDPKDDWPTFYTRWERAGLILEHLFLARIRDEAANLRMPTRLLELVRHYPHDKGTPSGKDAPQRLRFTTRRYDALFVRVDSEVSGTTTPAKPHPLRLVVEALKSESPDGSQNDAVWEELRKASMSEGVESSPTPEGYPVFSRIFTDETMRLLSLIPADKSFEEPSSPVFTLIPKGPSPHRRSFSLSDKDKVTNDDIVAPVNGSATKTPASPTTEQATSVAVPTTDWAQFSTAGFGETNTVGQALAATLLDADVEKTEPPVAPRKQSKKRKAAASPARGRRSLQDDKPAPAHSSPARPAEEAAKITSKSSPIKMIQLDEAFIDFWSDALLDPISRDWPNFVICKLSNPVSVLPAAEKPVEWLVIEHHYNLEQQPSTTTAEESTSRVSKRSRPSSPKPSFRSDITGLRMSSTLAATRKRFRFLTGGRSSAPDDGETTQKDRKKHGKSPKVGEMGEILAEEEEKPAQERDSSKAPEVPPKESTKAAGLGFVEPGSAAVVAATAAVTAAEVTQQTVVPPTIPPKTAAEGESAAAITQQTETDIPAAVVTESTDAVPENDVKETDMPEDQADQADVTAIVPPDAGAESVVAPAAVDQPNAVPIADDEPTVPAEGPDAVEESVEDEQLAPSVEPEPDVAAEIPEVRIKEAQVPEPAPVVEEPVVESQVDVPAEEPVEETPEEAVIEESTEPAADPTPEPVLQHEPEPAPEPEPEVALPADDEPKVDEPAVLEEQDDAVLDPIPGSEVAPHVEEEPSEQAEPAAEPEAAVETAEDVAEPEKAEPSSGESNGNAHEAVVVEEE